MILYHGLSIKPDEIKGQLLEGTWLAKYRFHAFRIAERRVTQLGGEAIVLEIDTNSYIRVEGRNNPTYLYGGDGYKLLAIHKMIRHSL